MKTSNKKLILSIFLMLLYATIFCQTMAEPPSNYHDENAGTEDNPFLISNLGNLRWLSETTKYWGFKNDENPQGRSYHFRQTADIDAYENQEWNEGYGFSPIGKSIGIFRGFYNGGNKVIWGLYQNSDEMYMGLFGFIRDTTLRNIRLEEINIIARGNFGYIGPIVSRVLLSSTITNCSATGNINAISGEYMLGGLVGDLWHSNIDNSYSLVHIIYNMPLNVEIHCSVGGITAYLGYSSLTNSYFKGSIMRASEYGNVNALVAIMHSATMQNCYVASTTDTINHYETLVGTLVVSITEVNWEENIIKNCFWDESTTGITELFRRFSHLPGSTEFYTFENNYGFSTEEMMIAETYTQYGWNFKRIWSIDSDINDGYPFLQRNKPYEPVNNKDITINKLANLIGNYPNPFNPETTISFALHKETFASIDIYNIKGQKIRGLMSEFLGSGNHQVFWNGTDDNGRNVSSGVYFYRLITDDFTQTKRMVMMK